MGFRGDASATEEAKRLGAVLKAARRAARLNQAEAGARAGMTGQGWGLYESGKRPGLFRPDVRRRLAAALGVEPERLTGTSQPSTRPRSSIEGDAHQVVMTDDRLDPWAGAGTVIEYDPARFPRRGQGCVVEAADGTLTVWLFDGADADRLHLRGGEGGLNDRVGVDRSGVLRVCAVTARRDG